LRGPLPGGLDRRLERGNKASTKIRNPTEELRKRERGDRKPIKAGPRARLDFFSIAVPGARRGEKKTKKKMHFIEKSCQGRARHLPKERSPRSTEEKWRLGRLYEGLGTTEQVNAYALTK